MTTRPESVATIKKRLAKARDDIAKSKGKVDDLRATRDEFVCLLVDDGVDRDEIAELAGISKDMVKLILSKRTKAG